MNKSITNLNWKIKTIFIIFTALLIFLLWLNVLHAPFVFDDTGNIKGIYAIQINSLSFNSLKNVITKTYAKNRPLANLTFALNWYFGKDNTFGYHLVNLIIHWLSSIFLFLFLQELFFLEKAKIGLEEKYIKYLPYIITLLWLSSPLQIQSVTYIVQRMTSMAGMFFFLALFFYVKGRRVHKKYLYILSVFSWTLSLLCKEITIILPFIIILYEWIFVPDNQKIDKKKFIRYIFLSLTLIFLSVILYSLLSGKNLFTGIFLADFSKRGYTMLQRVMTQWRVLIFYISLLLFPLPSRLNIDHYITTSTGFFSPLTTILSLATILGLIYLAYKVRKKHPLLSFGIFWYFLTLVIESSILNLELIFEHRLYIPSLGFWLIVVCLILHISQTAIARHVSPVITRYFPSVIARSEATKQSHHKKDIILISIFILVLTGQSYGTILRNQVWQDDLTLWEDAVQKSPNKARPHNNLGLAYYEKDWDDEAIKEFEIAIEMEPDYAKAYNNLGVVYYDKGLHDRAITAYKQALNIESNYASACYNLGIIYDEKGLYDQAMKEYETAIKANPVYAEAYNNLGIVYGKGGLYDQAIDKCKEALNIKSNYADAYYNLGVIYAKKGWYDQAIMEYKKAIKIKPNYVKAYYNLGNIYNKKKLYDQAIAEYKKLLEIKPDYAEAYNNLGVVYYDKGWYDQAIIEYEKAFKIDSNYADAYYNLGNVYKKKELNNQAINEYKKALKIKPDYTEAYYNLGVVYYNQGLYNQAIAEYRRALEIKPDVAGLYYNLGLVYYDMGWYDQAMIEYKKALQINPVDKNAHYYLTLIYKNKKQNDKAVFHLKECLKYETNEEWKKKEEDLLQQLIAIKE